MATSIIPAMANIIVLFMGALLIGYLIPCLLKIRPHLAHILTANVIIRIPKIGEIVWLAVRMVAVIIIAVAIAKTVILFI
jgi:hypothetical protein